MGDYFGFQIHQQIKKQSSNILISKKIKSFLMVYFNNYFTYFNYSKPKMKDQKQEQQVTLIYHNFRGMAQSIRYVLYFLDIPFSEIFLNHGESASSLDILKKKNCLEEVQLPWLIDGDYVIQDSLAMIRYLCTKANRQDLLGQNLEQRALIREIHYNHTLKCKKPIKLLFKFGEDASRFPEKKQELRKLAFLQSHKQSGSLIQTVKLKLRNPGQKYIFSHMTILDFLFYEQCFYQINFFGNLEVKVCKILRTFDSFFGTGLSNTKEEGIQYLNVMRQFKESFQSEPFYLENKKKIESYSVLCPIISQFSKNAFRKVWLGPQFYVK